MCKGKSFFWEGIIYQILWIIASTILFFIIYKILDNFFVDSINKGLPLDKFSSFYFEIGKYIILLLEIIFILLGTFIIQRKRFYAYNQFFESGLNYLKSEDKDLIAFHESLSKERDIFIELHNYHKELEKKYDLVYKEKTDLLTYLAHDIKTPLANMIGYTTLLKDEKNLSEKQKSKFVDVIYENMKYLNRLSEDFFSYLKFNLNEIPINLMDVDIKIFFSQWEEEKRLSIKNHLLILEFLYLEDTRIKTEPQLLLRIMDNLITNAVNYSIKETSININVETINRMLKISVINDVSKNLNVNWNMATSKFYRGDLSRRISNNGSGLGLTIVNDIVKHLGGNFEIGEENQKVYAKVILPYDPI